MLIEVLRRGDASYSSRGGTIPPNPAVGGGQTGKGGLAGTSGGASQALPPGPASAMPMAASVGGGVMSGRRGSKYQLTMQHLLIGIGGLVVLLAFVWFIAFKSGQSAADSKWVGKVPMGATSPDGGTPTGSLDKPGPGDGVIDPNGNGIGGVPIPQPKKDEFKPQPPRPEPQVQTQLVAGMNYLLVERFRRTEDADAAGKYLASNGLTVMIAKGSELDVGSSSDWLFVVVLQPFEKPASDPEASKLRDRVQQLGRSWRAQNRLSPSDFSQPYWKKFAGKK